MNIKTQGRSDSRKEVRERVIRIIWREIRRWKG